MRRRIHACHMSRRIHACHMRRRIHACHTRRRIHACHTRRRIHAWHLRGGGEDIFYPPPQLTVYTQVVISDVHACILLLN
jgi:hypothetical protein